MSYETVEAGLQTEIVALANFTAEQVSLNDWRILSHGVTHAAILEYQSFEAERHSSDFSTLFRWVTRIHLLVRYSDDATANNNMRDRRDEIITCILENPKLGGSALDSLPIFGEAIPEEVEVGGVSFLHEHIDVTIEEVVSA